ncbi:MAG: SBBP repeat-containing protein, partial [Flavobacteriales bacterium]|nr:SBBP repeat-containing protein [Flavobacteriales bacterium]
MVAQEMVANWLRNGGGIGNDEAFDMDTDGNGNYFTTGYFSGTAEFGTLSVTSSGPGDVFVMRSSEQGQVTWVKKFGGSGSDRANAIATDPSGNSYITGVFSQTAQFGAFTLTSSSDVLDVFIAKIDASGNVLWAVSCGGVYDDYAYGIDVDPSGNVLVTGKFMGTAQIGAANFTSAWNTELDVYSYDIFFAKLDPLGNWLWAKQGSAEDDDRGLDITSDLVGNVYVTGQFSDTLSMDGEHPNEVENAGFLARYSSEGLFEWIVLFSATQTQCYDIQCDPGGDVLACGEYIGQMLIVGPDNYFVPYSHPYNIFLMRFDDEGQLVWASQEGSENAVSAKALCIGQEGEVYVTGTFSCVFTEFSDELGSGLFNSVGFRDVFIIRYSESGERIWNRQYGGSRDDYCSGIARGSLTDTPIIAGSFSDLFNVPENINFELYPDNYVYVPCQEYIAGWQDCYDESYQEFFQVLSSGNKDVFFTRPYASDAHHYDYYIRSTLIGCSFDALEPCISYHLSPICYDTIQFCDLGLLKGITNTLCSYSPGLAPLYIFEWEDGSDQPDTLIYQSGTYGLEIRREDYCDSWTKEVEVIVSVSPPFPLLSDDIIINEDELPWEVTDLAMCLDSVWLYGTTSCTQCTIEWLGPGYFAEGVDSVEAWDGLYTFRVTDTTGCSAINDIYVNQIEQVEVDTILQDFQILYQGQVVSGDSIEICAGEEIVLMYLDNGV